MASKGETNQPTGNETNSAETKANSSEPFQIEIQCNVCAIPLGPPDSHVDSPTLPFVALSCQDSGCQTNPNQGTSYYCVPGCWEHFLKYQWGLYSGLGQAHQLFSRGLLGEACGDCRSDLTLIAEKGSLSLEESLKRISPDLLAKALTIFQSTVEENKNKKEGTDKKPKTEEDEQQTIIRRITQELEHLRLLKCPSCNYKIGIPDDRGCDAAWCEHCGRALCLYCLTDCGDNPKTDPTAKSSRLIGDAHDHVLNNDCGLTAGKGIAHSGKTLPKYHEQQFLRKVALRLKRVPEPIRDQICQNLAIEKETFEQMAEASAEASKPHSLTEQRREMENEKWEAWSQDLRVNFLHSAWRGDELLTQSLLETGIPCSIPDAVTGETALHFAASKGRAKVVQILLEHGADPWQLSPPGRTPLDDLCNLQSSCDLETARLLVRACMVRAPAIYRKGKEIYPWLRPWPNGETAESSAKQHHPTSPVKDYFAALKDFSFKLAVACADGETDSVEQLLSNKTTVFPRLGTELPLLPPAQDLIWIYNEGSGCTPLLDLCAKSFQHSSANHTVSSAERILEVAKILDDDGDTSNSTIRRLLQMRDFKFLATVFHWLALDPKPMILRLVGRLLRHVGKPLSDFVDRQGHTPMDWAKNYAMNEVALQSEERQKHIARWEAIHLTWVEHMIENSVAYDQ